MTVVHWRVNWVLFMCRAIRGQEIAKKMILNIEFIFAKHTCG